jgi:hypothetical protein
MIFKKRRTRVEAVKWKGDNYKEVKAFCKEWSLKGKDYVSVINLGGVEKAMVGDWIVKTGRKDYHVCKPDVFNRRYERIE